MAAQTNDIGLIDLGAWARNSGFFEKYPYFTKLSDPAGTYRDGITRLLRSRTRPSGWQVQRLPRISSMISFL